MMQVVSGSRFLNNKGLSLALPHQQPLFLIGQSVFMLGAIYPLIVGGTCRGLQPSGGIQGGVRR